MICDHPDCAGVHTKKRPRAEWCPAMRQRERERDRTRKRSPAYLERHRERRRARLVTDPAYRERERERDRTRKAHWTNAHPVAAYLKGLRRYRRGRGEPLPGEVTE